MNSQVVVPVRAEVVSARPVGDYLQVALTVPAVGTAPRPGQFLVAPAPAGSARVLPRTWWLAGGHTDPGYGTTLEVVLPAEQDQLRPHDVLLLTGPLGRGFTLPVEPVPVVVVGQELASAPARWLAGQLHDRGCSTHLVLVADDPDRHLDVVSARRLADSVVLSGSAGVPATVAEVAERTGAHVLYAAGPVSLCRAVSQAGRSAGAACQVTAFDAGAGPWCGVGLCGACTVAVGEPARPVRPCVEGPVLRGERIRWAPW